MTILDSINQLKFAIDNVWFVSALVFLTVTITVLTTFFKLKNETGNNIWSKSTIYGKLSFFALIITIPILILQEFNSRNNEVNNERKIFQLQLSIKDSIYNKVDSTYKHTIIATNEALAKYNLKFTDSLESVIHKLNLEKVNPLLTIRKPTKKDKNFSPIFFKDKLLDKLNVQIISYKDICYNIEYQIFILEPYSLKILDSTNKKTDNRPLITESIRTYEMEISNRDIFNYDELLVLIKGSYSKDLENQYKLELMSGNLYDFKNQKYLGKTAINYDIINSKMHK